MDEVQCVLTYIKSRELLLVCEASVLLSDGLMPRHEATIRIQRL